MIALFQAFGVLVLAYGVVMVILAVVACFEAPHR